MKEVLVLLYSIFPLILLSQSNLSGVYEHETVCCQCTLDMMPNQYFKLKCKRHYQSDFSKSGRWSISSDTLSLKFQSDTLYFSIKNDDMFYRVNNRDTLYDAMIWNSRPFISQKNYYENGGTSIEKTWKYFNRKGMVKHGQWKYYDQDGGIEKVEIYRRGKLRKIKYYSQ